MLVAWSKASQPH